MRTPLARALLSFLVVSISSAGCLVAADGEEGQTDDVSEENVASEEQAILVCSDITEMEDETFLCSGGRRRDCTRQCVTDRYLVALPPVPGGPLSECRTGLRTCSPWACTLCY